MITDQASLDAVINVLMNGTFKGEIILVDKLTTNNQNEKIYQNQIINQLSAERHKPIEQSLS